jgi:hypothetical protein
LFFPTLFTCQLASQSIFVVSPASFSEVFSAGRFAAWDFPPQGCHLRLVLPLDPSYLFSIFCQRFLVSAPQTNRTSQDWFPQIPRPGFFPCRIFPLRARSRRTLFFILRPVDSVSTANSPRRAVSTQRSVCDSCSALGFSPAHANESAVSRSQCDACVCLCCQVEFLF